MLTSPGGLAKIASWAPALEILIQPVPGRGGVGWGVELAFPSISGGCFPGTALRGADI